MTKMVFMLNLIVSGIKNLEDEIRIDFCSRNVNKNTDLEKYKVKGIYGENGSGKTAIVTAVDIVKEFMINPNYLRDPQKQALLRELINKNKREFLFKCEFVTNIEHFLIYEYEVIFSFDKNDEIFVSYESLKYKKNSTKNMQSTLFLCKGGDLKELSIGRENGEEIKDQTRNLLTKQCTLFSIFNIYAGEDNVKMPHELLCAAIFFLMLMSHYDRSDKHIDYINRSRLDRLRDELSSEEMAEELRDIIPATESRIPVAEFPNYKARIERLERFIRIFKPELVKIEIEKKPDKEYYQCELVMNYGSYKVYREFESTGIKKIIEIYDALVLASNGAVVFIDEMDSNINDIYLCRIIEYFKYYGKGQLCFTSHNIDPMTVVKDNNKSIDFLTRDHRIVSWVKNGHYTPESSYRNGMIEGMPFNVDASDFIKVFERVK